MSRCIWAACRKLGRNTCGLEKPSSKYKIRSGRPASGTNSSYEATELGTGAGAESAPSPLHRYFPVHHFVHLRIAFVDDVGVVLPLWVLVMLWRVWQLHEWDRHVRQGPQLPRGTGMQLFKQDHQRWDGTATSSVCIKARCQPLGRPRKAGG